MGRFEALALTTVPWAIVSLSSSYYTWGTGVLIWLSRKGSGLNFTKPLLSHIVEHRQLCLHIPLVQLMASSPKTSTSTLPLFHPSPLFFSLTPPPCIHFLYFSIAKVIYSEASGTWTWQQSHEQSNLCASYCNYPASEQVFYFILKFSKFLLPVSLSFHGHSTREPKGQG